MTNEIKNWEERIRDVYKSMSDLPGRNLAFEDYLLPAIKTELSSHLTELLQGLISEIEGEKKGKEIWHGADCKDGRRPCGYVQPSERLADRCEIQNNEGWDSALNLAIDIIHKSLHN